MPVNVDLTQLAVQRDRPAPAPSSPRRWHVWSRIVLPLLLVAGFVALVGYALRDSLSPPRAVTVIPVISAQAAMDAPPDTPLFRAAGWVEPRPTPILVTALAEGVVETLLVAEGQEVKLGDIVARLVRRDAELAHDTAEAEVQLRDGELASARAAQTAARDRHEHPVHLQGELADAQAALAKLESDLAHLPAQTKAVVARQSYAARNWESKQRARDAVAATALAKSRSELDAANAAVEELASREKRLPIEIAALKQKRDAVQEKLRRKVDEVRQLAEADAAVRISQAKKKQAESLRDASALRLERMTLRAPCAGRVLSLVARPGTRLNGIAASALQDSSTVLTLYDPARLQVRVDVRLDDVARVQSGQKVRIESAAMANQTLVGEVLLATSQADIQKNTLSVKVAIADPPPALRPEMLCQVTFLAPPRPATPGKGSEPYRLLIPRQLIEGGAVWVVDQVSGTARLRKVEVGLTTGDLVAVVSGLNASDKLIVGGRDGLREGLRVRVVGEDESLGLLRD